MLVRATRRPELRGCVHRHRELPGNHVEEADLVLIVSIGVEPAKGQNA